MKVKIKDALGNVREFECLPTDSLKSLLDKYKPFVVAPKGQTVRSIIFLFAGDNFKEDDMDDTLDNLGIEDGLQITALILYNGRKK